MTTIRPNSRTLREVRETPWMITPGKLQDIASLIEAHAAGIRFDAEEIAAAKVSRREVVLALEDGSRVVLAGEDVDLFMGPHRPLDPKSRLSGAVAVLPVFGTIFPRANLMSEMSGGTSLERFTQNLRAASADPNVRGIVLEVDSPGGIVYGVDEAATEIHRTRASKPIIAIANNEAASAAYYLASQADELIVTPSGQVGSIGVIGFHEDWSRAYEKAGVTPTLITAGKFKGEGSDSQPLSVEAKAYMQARINEYYGMFVRAVARGRGVSVDRAKGESFGQGRLVGAAAAVAAGMADRVGTLEVAIERARSGKSNVAVVSVGGTVAAASVEEIYEHASPAITEALDAPKVAASLRRRQVEVWGMSSTPKEVGPTQ